MNKVIRNHWLEKLRSWLKVGFFVAVSTSLLPTTLAQAYYAPASVTTLAGNGMLGLQDGSSAQAMFHFPTGIAVATDGTMYIADTQNQRIRVVNARGVVSTLAGFSSQTNAYGAPVGGDQNGSVQTAEFNQPIGLALSPNDKILYVADSGNGKIRKINLATGQVTTLVEGLNVPTFMVTLPNGSMYVSETGRNRILHIQPDGAWTVFAGGGYKTASDGTWIGGYRDGVSEHAQFRSPQGLVLSSNGTLYVADSGNQRIRAISPTGSVTTVAGSGHLTVNGGTALEGGYANGKALHAQFNFPTGLALGKNGVIYIADTYNHCIRALLPHGVVETVAGSTSFGRINGLESMALFDNPTGIAVLPNGNLVVVDRLTDSIREVIWYTLPHSILSEAGWKVVINHQILTSTPPPMMIHHHLYLPLEALLKKIGINRTSNVGRGRVTLTLPTAYGVQAGNVVKLPTASQTSGSYLTLTVQVGSPKVIVFENQSTEGTTATVPPAGAVGTGSKNASVATTIDLSLTPIEKDGQILVPWQLATHALGLELTWMPADHVYLIRSE